ncbi:hypothetical protein ACIGXG_22945 [Streptomyces goshikiensis]|uniref:hypothetical protein n=1 Tax=Streptomyces goshikiensis TaxID=1942 RepID=UPI0037D4E0C5
MHQLTPGDGEPGRARAADRGDGSAGTEAVVFVCTACATPLTTPLTRLPAVPEAPDHPFWDVEEPGPWPPTVPSGRFAIETEPYGAPLVVSDVPGPVMPRQGVSVNVHSQHLVSDGPRGNIVINPGDARHLELEHACAACCGASPEGGMNQVCVCGTLVATLSSDCCLPHELHLSAAHVRAVPAARP